MVFIRRVSLFGVSLSLSLTWHIVWFLVFKPIFNFEVPIRKDLLRVTFLGSFLKRSDLYQVKVNLRKHKKIVPESDTPPYVTGKKPKESKAFYSRDVFHKPVIQHFQKNLFTKKDHFAYKRSTAFSYENKNDIASAVFKPDFSAPSLFLLNEAISTAVKLKILISSRGDVINILRKTSCGNPRIDLLIMRSVKSWYFLNPGNRKKEWLEVKLDFTKDRLNGQYRF